MGFGGSREHLPTDEDAAPALLRQVNSEDLLQFGLIPEFVGRLPVVVGVDPLDEDDLVLTRPKNALVRQYKKLFTVDDVELEFTPDALRTTTSASAALQDGRRGRTIIEETLLDVVARNPPPQRSSTGRWRRMTSVTDARPPASK